MSAADSVVLAHTFAADAVVGDVRQGLELLLVVADACKLAVELGHTHTVAAALPALVPELEERA